MIDSHCHLALEAFTADREQVILRAKEAGVRGCIVVADSLEESEAAALLARSHPGYLWSTAGLHPHRASSWQSADAERLRSLARDPTVRAIGEIGLDYHYDRSPREMQQSVFAEQLGIAQELDLPVIVHTREAIEDTWRIIQEHPPRALVLHCCTEQFKDVERFLDAGYLLSFTGIATYGNAAEVRATIRECPLAQLMLETDAPFLAPVPHRGKRNEPAYLIEVARAVAEAKGIPLAEVVRVTAENARAFFGLGM